MSIIHGDTKGLSEAANESDQIESDQMFFLLSLSSYFNHST